MSTLSHSAEQAGAKAPATACRKCGSTRFFVLESMAYCGDVHLYSDGTPFLHCYDGDGGIDSITCRQCGAKHTPETFTEIIIN